MAQHHQHTGPVSKFVDWWKDYEDVQKMEEYTEYIGVCKGCFDPRSSVLDAPRKHHYYKRRSNEHMRPSGGIEKQSRYNLKERKSQSSFSGEDRRKSSKSSNTAAGWMAAGLGGIGLAKAGKAVFSAGRDDFDDTYSIKSGRSGLSRHSRSRSRDRKSYSYGYSGIRHRSRSADRMSQMSVGVTSDRKDRRDHKAGRRRSRAGSSSSSNSGHGKSGLIGTAIGAGLAGVALGAVTGKKRNSRSKSPKRVQVVHHRRDSSDDERRRRSQQLRHKASRSSTSGASVIEIGGQNHEAQGGFLQGFFAAPPPKEKRPKPNSLKKKKKGFFNFSNDSTSSSDSEMAFGTGYVRRRRRSSHTRRSSPKRRSSDERLKASLIGLGATAAAITAAKAGKSKRNSEVVAVKENRLGRKSSQSSRPGSRFGDDEWEDLPDDGTSESSSDGGLAYGDHALKKSKSNDSIGSNDSGTNKWGWRWGFGKKKRRPSNNLYDNIAETSFIGPTAAGAAGALAGAAAATTHGRHDSESSSAQTLQSVYPVAPNDPNASFDARRTSSIATSQPLVTSGPGPISLQQPQPMHQVPGAIYSTQAPSQSTYTAPAGPPVFSQMPSQAQYPIQSQAQNIFIQNHPQQPAFRRANSSPIQSSSWKRDAAIAALAAGVTASAMKHHDRPPSRPPSASSNVRFNLTQEQADKEMRERRRQQERLEEEENRRREAQDRMDEEADRQREEQRLRDEAAWEEEELARREQQRRDDEVRRAEDLRRAETVRREEEERLRLELQRQEDEARKVEDERRETLLRLEETARQEDERRRRELQRQQDEARKFMDIQGLAKLENDRRREQQDAKSRAAREAEDRERQQRAAFMEHQRQLAIEATEAERKRRERREFQQQEAERIEAARREAEIQEDLERRRRESQDYGNRYGNDQARLLEQQPTGSSMASTATVVQRRDQELQEREREVFKPESKKSSVAGAVAAGAAAALKATQRPHWRSQDGG
jgi:hypothetical protein